MFGNNCQMELLPNIVIIIDNCLVIIMKQKNIKKLKKPAFYNMNP